MRPDWPRLKQTYKVSKVFSVVKLHNKKCKLCENLCFQVCRWQMLNWTKELLLWKKAVEVTLKMVQLSLPWQINWFQSHVFEKTSLENLGYYCILCMPASGCFDLFLGTIAFHTVLTSYSTIPDESAVLFNEVLLNQGEGWVVYFRYFW